VSKLIHVISFGRWDWAASYEALDLTKAAPDANLAQSGAMVCKLYKRKTLVFPSSNLPRPVIGFSEAPARAFTLEEWEKYLDGAQLLAGS